MNKPLRIGILLDSFVQPSWVEKVLKTIQSSDFARIEFVVLNTAQPKRENSLRKLWRHRQHLAYKAYTRLDNFFFRPKPDAFARVNLERAFQNCPTIRVNPIQKKFSDYFPDAALAEVRGFEPDVLLRFGFRILRGEILHAAKYGIWSYHHGDNEVNRGGPPGFWEVMKGEPVTGSVLQVLTEDLDAGKVIYRSYARTNTRSVKRNRNNYYWKSAQFVIRKLRDLSCATSSDPLNINSLMKPYSRSLYKKPTNLEVARYAGGLLWRNAREKAKEAYTRKQWFLAFRFQNISEFSTSLHLFNELIPPEDRYWADPFPVKYDDRFFIFIEEYLYTTKRGHISVLELNRDGSHTAPYRILEDPQHLSYPFIFQWKSDFYMIPENSGSGSVQLYRCSEFPGRWEPAASLLDGVRAVDTTLAEVDGRWWMFANIAVDGASTFDELHLFYSDSPLGPWKAHRKNPVKSDCRSSRPAGNLLRLASGLYRPAQDCSIRYGYAISINKIVRLDMNDYEETETFKIYPTWKKNLLATHTINCLSELTVVDAMALRSKFF